MAGSVQEEDDGMISGINVTPLVDITLVLLIIFMVTASYIARAAIEVDLPRAASGGTSNGQMLAVVLKPEEDATGAKIRGSACHRIAVNGTFTDEAALRRALRDALSKDADAKALISADTDCTHGEVVHLIDLIKTEGITKFAINIEQEATGKSGL